MTWRLPVVAPDQDRAPWWDIAVVAFMIAALVALLLYLWLVPPAPQHPRAAAFQDSPRPRRVVSGAAGAGADA